MKTNPWLILGVLLSTTLLAQQQMTPPPDATPATPPPATAPAEPATPVAEPAPAQPAESAPAATPVKKKKKHVRHVARKEIEEPFVALVAGQAVVSGKNVNVRARPKLNSEVITKLNTGDAVTVIEQINLEKAEPGEPKQWAKIAFPSSASVWVRSSFVDANSTVSAKKLNLRAGPGENYNIVGSLDSGSAVKQVTTKGDWMKIEPPADAFAFVAAQYLRQESGFQPNAATATNGSTPEMAMTATPPPPAEITPPPAETTPAPATLTPPPGEQTVTPAPTQAAPAGTSPAEVIASAPQQAAPAAPETEQPLPPRIVSHEGMVKPTVSVQAPTDYDLESIETGKLEDFLYTTTTNLDLAKYNGLHIVATGEESIDDRWTNTPVLTIRRIQVVQ